MYIVMESRIRYFLCVGGMNLRKKERERDREKTKIVYLNKYGVTIVSRQKSIFFTQNEQNKNIPFLPFGPHSFFLSSFILTLGFHLIFTYSLIKAKTKSFLKLPA